MTITEAQINEEAKKITESQISEEVRRKAKKRIIDRERKQKMADEKKAEAKRKADKKKNDDQEITRLKAEYDKNLPNIFNEMLDGSIKRAMVRFVKNGGMLTTLETLYKLSIIKINLGGIK